MLKFEGSDAVLIPLTKGQRAVIQEGLGKLPQGFAAEINARLENTRCSACHGNGLAPYVGGDDDEVPCDTCGGTGFKMTGLRAAMLD